MSTSRRRFLVAASAAAASPLLAFADTKGNDPAGEVNAARDMITDEAQKAIDRGLDFLARSQHDNGSWGDRNYQGNIAVTSLAALAFMAGGHQPGRGKYGQAVERAIGYVMGKESSDIKGYLYTPGGSQFGAMYSHGFGTLLLGEAYGMIAKKEMQKRLRDTLERAVALIIKAQNKTQGGWRYDTQGSSADVSVTICQIMALRSARNAGLQVPKSVVEQCTKYVKACQNIRGDGGFNYMLGTRDNSAFPRSAAGVVALFCAGIYEGREIDAGMNYLMQFKPGGRINNFGGMGRNMHEMHYYYGQYYAAQAMWTAGGKYWQEWFPAIREELLSRARQGQGVWTDPTVCTDYGTAMALIILQIPNNYLPIMQK